MKSSTAREGRSKQRPSRAILAYVIALRCLTKASPWFVAGSEFIRTTPIVKGALSAEGLQRARGGERIYSNHANRCRSATRSRKQCRRRSGTRLTCKRAMIEIHGIPAQRFNRTQSARNGRWCAAKMIKRSASPSSQTQYLTPRSPAVQRDCKRRLALIGWMGDYEKHSNGWPRACL